MTAIPASAGLARPSSCSAGGGPRPTAYNFYYEVRSTVKLLKAINQATTRREKKVLRNHLDSRIRLNIGEGTTTYLSYIGMTKTQGAELRGDLHRNGTSGATKLCLATQGATNAILGPAIHVQVAALDSPEDAEWAVPRGVRARARTRDETPVPDAGNHLGAGAVRGRRVRVERRAVRAAAVSARQ